MGGVGGWVTLLMLKEFTRKKKEKKKEKKVTVGVEPRSKRKITQTTGAPALLKTVHIHLGANPRSDVSGNAVLGQSWMSKASSVLTWVFQCKPLGHTAR